MLSLREINLYKQVFIEPLGEGFRDLTIVSGYASPRMLAKYLSDIRGMNLEGQFRLRLVIGMAGDLSDGARSAYQSLMFSDSDIESVIYLPDGPLQVHSKCFLWRHESAKAIAWVGSPNFTMLGFGLSQESDSRDEIIAKVEPSPVVDYTNKVIGRSSILDGDTSRPYLENNDEFLETQVATSKLLFELPRQLSLKKFAICPLVNVRNGEVHNPGAGLNWGQPSETRSRKDRDAAYIPLPSSMAGIFPEIGVPFEVELPDGQIVIMARSQSGGKAITTPSSNEILGRFFRSKLGVNFGDKISTGDLKRFGADCVIFEKMAPLRFRMHFASGLYLADLSTVSDL